MNLWGTCVFYRGVAHACTTQINTALPLRCAEMGTSLWDNTSNVLSHHTQADAWIKSTESREAVSQGSLNEKKRNVMRKPDWL